MKFLIKHNLMILSVYTLIMLGVLVAFWDSFLLVQRFIIGFLVLITLHEWEETKYPGGFMEIMSGMMCIDISKAPEGSLHLSQAIYITAITLLPLLFPGAGWLSLSLMILGIFEGVVHILGIKLTKREKPYTPGMITGQIMLVFSGIGIYFVVSKGIVHSLDWLLAVILFLGGFFLMQAGVFRVLGLKYVDAIKIMRERVKSMHS
ncbi:HXXEE domain-containing protein [Flexilinea flocculi]|uniref:HXXEE domain-containing protein n=1 Tax=Flexilinea flocculi TaxID=1678840 RepID=A0A0S7BTY5_9CHLR|nr:HXXEE domain-containing protein [Flexilinea flocculi]GAP40945.1 protein of unknown function with HXXEE motif [Flexilinea flocculi]